MKIKILKLIILALLLNSCSDYFDVSPKSNVKAEDLFQDEIGFNQALIGVYTLMSTQQMYGDNLSYGFLDVLAQYYPLIKANTDHNFYNDADFNYDDINVEKRINTIWSRHYQAIANLNSILDFIDDNAGVFSDGVYDVYKGETIALRGYLHFNLLRLFAQAPTLGTNTQGIPYMDQYTNQAQAPLTIAETLNKIKDDLEFGRELMRDKDPYGENYQDQNEVASLEDREYRMNFYAATATLSIVSLYEGDKANALKYAQEVIGTLDGSQSRVELFEFADIANDLSARSETIFGLNITKLEDYQDEYFSEAASSGQQRNWLAIDASVIEQVYTPSGASSVDPRGNVFFGPNRNGDRALAKYVDLNSAAIMPLLKISELYLIAAETESDINNALSYFNMFTASRGIEAQDGLSREQLDEEIYKEYKKEFIGEGKLFLYYKRKNASQIGILDGVEIDQESYTLPIPASEIEFGNF